MKTITNSEVEKFVAANIVRFHQSRINRLESIKLKDVLRKKNPYLFRAKNVLLGQDLVQGILDAFLSSSEEELFGNFLEELAIFIASKTLAARKSSAEGIDFEFAKGKVHYIVSVKSGVNWGNSAQQQRQEDNFKKAVKVLKQSASMAHVESVLGCCYGRTKTTHLRGYTKIAGQSFWHFISGNPDLYTDIIEPLGHKAREHNDAFLKSKAQLVNQFTQEVLAGFSVNGVIDWHRLVEFNSGNLDATSLAD